MKTSKFLQLALALAVVLAISLVPSPGHASTRRSASKSAASVSYGEPPTYVSNLEEHLAKHRRQHFRSHSHKMQQQIEQEQQGGEEVAEVQDSPEDASPEQAELTSHSITLGCTCEAEDEQPCSRHMNEYNCHCCKSAEPPVISSVSVADNPRCPCTRYEPDILCPCAKENMRKYIHNTETEEVPPNAVIALKPNEVNSFTGNWAQLHDDYDSFKLQQRDNENESHSNTAWTSGRS